jgi:Na+-transporting NADH:ubiquinone oxidoreductase subunit NqrD
LFLAGAVFTMRVVGTIIDGGWREPYTRLALPTEAAFVLVVGIVRVLA